MPPLTAKERAQLPDRAFAYIDSSGRRRLPIHDAAHVRNALARFNQVAFEDDAARDLARNRLLRAAKKHGIMPIGFISAQLEPQSRLPTGQLTFLLTDLERSTELLRRLGDRYASFSPTSGVSCRPRCALPAVTWCPLAGTTCSPCSSAPRRHSTGRLRSNAGWGRGLG